MLADAVCSQGGQKKDRTEPVGKPNLERPTGLYRAAEVVQRHSLRQGNSRQTVKTMLTSAGAKLRFAQIHRGQHASKRLVEAAERIFGRALRHVPVGEFPNNSFW